MGLVLLGGLIKELLDCIDILGTGDLSDVHANIDGMNCAGWEAAIPGGTIVGNLFRCSCEDCCSSKHTR